MKLKLIFQDIITSDWMYRNFVHHRIKENFLKTNSGFIDVSNQNIFIICLIAFGFYESKELRCIRKYLRKDLDVIELGASIGLISLEISRQTKKRIISVEANPHLLSNLLSTKAKNNFIHLEFINAALSYSKESEIKFILDDNNLGSKIGDDDNAVVVPIITLNKLVSQHQITSFALVSDIEGAELDFILNEKDENVIANCMQIIIELHDTVFNGQFYCKDEVAALIVRKFNMQVINQLSSVWVFSR